MAGSDFGLFGALPRHTKWVIIGSLCIAWGLIATLGWYLNDSGALRIDIAPENGPWYGGVWIAVGAAIIACYTVGPGGPRRRSAHDHDAELRKHELRNHSQRHSERDLH